MSEASPIGDGARRRWAEAGIVAAAVAAYHNIFSNAFVFLDVADIAGNTTIRHLWPLTKVLSPPAAGGLTVGGRPMVNLSLALNYAMGGTAPWGYHAVNLAIHVLAALTLFGIVRRTVKANADATLIAFAVAVLWAVHPLQTESVTYVIQRAESLMGLFYLLTIYCFIRYAETLSRSATTEVAVDRGSGNREVFVNRSENLTVSATWAVLCVLTCLLGMLTKEVMVSAPVIIFLYDRAFLSGTFCQAWRSHRRLYLGMACTWVALGWLVLHSGERGGSAGFGIGVSWWSYVLTQFPAILHYLRLTLWPHPLVFDYWVDWVNQPWRVAPAAVVVAGLAAASLWGTFRPRAPKIAFLGLCFFAILAPTSLVPGKSQTLAEHRMYLALAPVIVGGVGAVYAGLGRRVLIIGFPLAALAGGWVTIHRNRAYRDDLTLWSDTAAIRPQNARAHFYRGVALGDAGRTAEEVRELNRALELNSDYPEAYDSLGIALAKTGANREAIGYYRKALRLKPELADAHYNLGTALAQLGRTPEAIAELEVALSLKAEYPEAQNNLGSALVTAGRVPEAAGHFSEAVRLMPERAEYSYDWAMALANLGRTPEAISRYEDALRLRPDYAEAQGNLGVALAMSGRTPEAIRHFERAAQLRPASPKAHYNLAGALVSSGRTAEAIAEYRRALRLQPDYYEAHYQLGMALRAAGHLAEADLELEAAERLQAGQPAAVP